MECELLQSPMISYQSLLYSTTVLYDNELCTSVVKYYSIWLLTGGACDDVDGLATLTGATGVVPGGVCSAGSG